MTSCSSCSSSSSSLLSRLAWMVATAVASLALLNPAGAATLTAAEEKSIRAVVEGQLAALAKDDAAKAFSYAAPNVREAVGSATRFISMVRDDYPVVYRPASVAFLKPEVKGDVVIQRVQMTDAEGDLWLAIYSLQRQKNKTWRISGCAVVENNGRMA